MSKCEISKLAFQIGLQIDLVVGQGCGSLTIGLHSRQDQASKTL